MVWLHWGAHRQGPSSTEDALQAGQLAPQHFGSSGSLAARVGLGGRVNGQSRLQLHLKSFRTLASSKQISNESIKSLKSEAPLSGVKPLFYWLSIINSKLFVSNVILLICKLG